MLVGENSHQLSVKMLIIKPLQLTATIRFMKILRNVDYEVSHLLQFIHHIHIINTRLVVSVSRLDAFYLLITEIVPLIVDAVLSCIGIRNLLKSTNVRSLKILYHSLIRIIN